jgi:branched-chain amino acid transport system substrate-binding protein
MVVRGKLFAALVTVAAMGAVTGCGSDDNGSSGGSKSSASKDPLRVVLIPPSSGALAVFGQDAVDAWKFAADEVNANGGVDGHKVVLSTVETDGTAAGTLRAARKAATQDKVNYISGVVTSVENAALAPQLTSMNAIVINGMSKDDSLTGKLCSPNAFRTAVSIGMDGAAIASTLDKLPAQKWAIQATDYLNGHTAAELFAAAAKKAGKQVVLTQFAPLNTTEFGSYITKLKGSGADGLFAQEQGSDGVAFINQGTQFKLFDQFKAIVGSNMVSEPLFKALGDKVVGFYNNLTYTPNIDNAANTKFVAAWKAKNGENPYYIHGDNYLTAQFLFEAVKKAKSVDPAKVKAAMDNLSMDSIVGPIRMRPEDHQLLRETYLGQIVKTSGGLGWKVVAAVPPDQTTPNPNSDCKL